MTYTPELPGTIKLWHSATIPYGWRLCDGSNGTPDMRGRVPVGRDAAQVEFDVLGETGGAKTQTHAHSFGSYGGADPGTRSSTIHTINSTTINVLQPYIVTNYIMKL